MREFVVTHRGSAWRDCYAAALGDPVRLICNPHTWVYQTSGRTVVALVRVAGDPLVVKLYFRANLVDRLESLFLGSRAARVAAGVRRLRRAGLAAPELVAVTEERPTWMLGRSCAVTLPVTGGVRADELWGAMSPASRIRFARELGAYVRDLHGRGAYPQDLRTENVLAVPQGASWRFVLVDLDRVRVYRRVSWRRRRKNLVQIERSLGRRARQTQRLAFLRAYLGPVSRRELARRGEEILTASRRKERVPAARR